MKRAISRIFGVSLFLLLLAPLAAWAHQPEIVTQSPTIVSDPEVSKAYYGQLSGSPQVFRIDSAVPFAFYAGLLVPDRPEQKKDVSAVIYEAGKESAPIARLDGLHFDWQPYYEQFGADYYFQGPEFKKQLSAGSYEIKVFSPNNDSRYSLAIGETESFPPDVIIKTLVIVPQLKRDFFASSPFTFLKSPFGIAYVVIMIVLAFLAGLLYHAAMRLLAKSKNRRSGHNIGTIDRLIRLLLGIILLLLGIYFWNAIILFLAGFCLFEAVFSWCGLYAALGKNTCPLHY